VSGRRRRDRIDADEFGAGEFEAEAFDEDALEDGEADDDEIADDEFDDKDEDVSYGRWYGRPFYPPAPPKLPPPAHGLKVRKIGGTWWGRRWIAALEAMSSRYANRLARGRGYARAGRVHDLVVRSGAVRARVTGSRRAPYAVTLRVAALPRAAWTTATQEMAKQAVFSVGLLAGEMPAEIDEAFRPAGASLFPVARRELVTRCTCPDVANPCKHVAAVLYVLGEAFDKDPFLLFELRGRAKDDVLDALRQARAAAGSGSRPRARRGGRRRAGPAVYTDGVPAVLLDASAAEAYEEARAPLGEPRFRIAAPTAHAGVLRALGAPASWAHADSILQFLGPAYEAASSLARRLALAPEEPAPTRRTRPRG